MPRNRIAETLAALAPSPANGSASPPQKLNGEHESPGTISDILKQAETTKTALHDAFSQINHLIGLLKRHSRQSKLIQTTLASHKQLQTLEV